MLSGDALDLGIALYDLGRVRFMTRVAERFQIFLVEGVTAIDDRTLMVHLDRVAFSFNIFKAFSADPTGSLDRFFTCLGPARNIFSRHSRL